MNKRLLLTLGTLLIIALGALVAFFLVKGYSFSPKEGRLVGTGLISVASAPDGASVYIDGHLVTATNATIPSLQPKPYTLKIIKEGFIPWEKKVEVAEGLVTEVKATLFPALPTLYPLTFNGVESPILSPDGSKLAFAVPFNADSRVRQKGGIWVWTMSNQPISFARSAEPHQLSSSTETLDFTKAKIKFSPDSAQVLVTLYEGKETEANLRNYLLPVDRYSSTSDLRDITPMVTATLQGWEDDQKTQDSALVAAIQDLKIRQIASSSAAITSNLEPITPLKWSPDGTKFIVASGSAKLYDLSSAESSGKNASKSNQGVPAALMGNKEYALPQALAYYWLPDSKHVILVGEDKISICELDGGNISEIYAGKFEDNLVFPWPDSSKLVILTSFNTTTALKPNFFGINLK